MKIEIRSSESAVIEGYVNVVERESRMIPDRQGNFIEIVTQWVFADAIKRAENIEVRFNHRKLLGDTKSKTLELHEDQIGLYAKAYVSDPTVIEAATKNELRGWSFGFIAKGQEWKDSDDGIRRRYLTALDLDEVTIVGKSMLPVYPATSIEMRDDTAAVIEFRSVDGEEVSVIDTNGKSKGDPPPKYDSKNDPVLMKIKSKIC